MLSYSRVYIDIFLNIDPIDITSFLSQYHILYISLNYQKRE